MPTPPCFALTTSTFTGHALRTTRKCATQPQRRVAVRRARAAAADAGAEQDTTNLDVIEENVPVELEEQQPSEPEPESEPEPVEENFSTEVPGKIVLDELTIAKQKTELDKYAKELRKKRIEEEREAARLFGFVEYAETLNGRLAMFFIVTGLLTEYWTGYTMPQQVELMLRTLGIL